MLLLPVLRITRGAYLTPLSRLGQVLASTWLHVAVTFAISFWLLPERSLGRVDFAYLAGRAVWCLTAAPAALAWHRWMLVGEPISARSALRFDARAIRFALLLLLVEIVGYLLSADLWLGRETIEEAISAVFRKLVFPLNAIAAAAFIVIPFVISIAILARFILVFPLCALDQRARLLRSSWTMSKGNGVRIFVIIALTTAPLAVLPLAPLYLYTWIGGISVEWVSLMAMLGYTLSIPCSFLSVPIAACAVSLLYRAVAPERIVTRDQAQS